MNEKGVALITGARKGIGKASAIALASAGFKVAITSSQPEKPVDVAGHPQSSGLTATADAISAIGAEVLPLGMNLLNRNDIDAAIHATIDRWGRIDILVNNAIYQGENILSPIMETDPEMLERVFLAQVVNTVYLTQRVVRGVEGKHPVRIINLGSGAGDQNRVPDKPVNKGGFAYSYAASKAALHRLAPLLHVELHQHGVIAFTLDPIVVQSESLSDVRGEVPGAASVDVPAHVISWLATSAEAARLSGSYLDSGRLYADIVNGVALVDRKA